MRARTAIGDGALDRFQAFGNFGFLHAGCDEPLNAARNHGLDTDGVSRCDAQDRLHRRVVVSPVHGLGAQREIVRAPGLRARRCRRQQQDGDCEIVC